jgi:hypothetical protein
MHFKALSCFGPLWDKAWRTLVGKISASAVLVFHFFHFLKTMYRSFFQMVGM